MLWWPSGMSSRRMAAFAATLVIAGALSILGWLGGTAQTQRTSAITISFLGFTNFPGNKLRYARFEISNPGLSDVRVWGWWSEVQSNRYKLAPVIDSRMTECRFIPVLKSKAVLTNVIGQPSDLPFAEPWRFVLAYSQYTVSGRWLDLAWRHPWMGRLGAQRFVDSQRILSPTNQMTAASPWLKR